MVSVHCLNHLLDGIEDSSLKARPEPRLRTRPWNLVTNLISMWRFLGKPFPAMFLKLLEIYIIEYFEDLAYKLQSFQRISIADWQ